MRAREPDESGVVRGTYWERFGDGEPTIVFVPPWSIVHSRVWKGQVPYFARRARVVTFDPRGNGRSERPLDRFRYTEQEYAEDLLAVMDASGTEEAVLVSLSRGAQRSLLAGDRSPERVLAQVFVAPALPFGDIPERARYADRFLEELDTDEGWAKSNAHYWRRDYRGFLEFFFTEVFPEPHSTKQFADAVGYGLDTDAEALIAASTPPPPAEEEIRAVCGRVRCPVLVIHGEDDRIRRVEVGEELAVLTGGRMMRLPDIGHCPQARKPVLVNIALREFLEDVALAERGQAKEVIHAR